MNICPDSQDIKATLLSSALIVGLVISYLPQHLRIINQKSSEGFSPWYLLLGATSSASGMLNVWILQFPLVQCCRVVNGKACFENLLGLAQVSLQWLLFSVILVLYLIYFPQHLKYARTLPLPPGSPVLRSPASETAPLLDGAAAPDFGATANGNGNGNGDAAERGDELENGNGGSLGKVKVETTPEWRLAVTLAIVVALHLSLLGTLAIALLYYLPAQPVHPLLSSYARFLGLTSTLLAIMQYAPQIYRTYKLKLVGALSIGTMAIQTPGSVMFVLSLVGREGVEWSSWLSYAVTGLMQGVLLVMCLMWRQRQRRLGHDDFGRPLVAIDQPVI